MKCYIIWHANHKFLYTSNYSQSVLIDQLRPTMSSENGKYPRDALGNDIIARTIILLCYALMSLLSSYHIIISIKVLSSIFASTDDILRIWACQK